MIWSFSPSFIIIELKLWILNISLIFGQSTFFVTVSMYITTEVLLNQMVYKGVSGQKCPKNCPRCLCTTHSCIIWLDSNIPHYIKLFLKVGFWFSFGQCKIKILILNFLLMNACFSFLSALPLEITLRNVMW